MRLSLNHEWIHIDRNRTVALADAFDVEVVCLSGCLWLTEDRLLEDALALHAVEVARGVARAGVPLRGVAVHALQARFDPADRPLLGGLAVVRRGRRDGLDPFSVGLERRPQAVCAGSVAIKGDQALHRCSFTLRTRRRAIRSRSPKGPTRIRCRLSRRQ